MEEDSLFAEAAEINEDKLDETRSNEAHTRHVVSSTGALVMPKDPVQANPLKGRNNAYHGAIKCGLICSHAGAHVTEEWCV